MNKAFIKAGKTAVAQEPSNIKTILVPLRWSGPVQSNNHRPNGVNVYLAQTVDFYL